MKPLSRNSWVILYLVLIGAVLRVLYLNQDVKYDEAYTYIHFAAQPLWTILSDYHFPNNHILHSLLVHLCIQGLGSEAWVVRLPALLAGISLIPLTYLAGKRLYSPWVGLCAAAAVSVAFQLVDYSANARGYTLIAACFLLLVLLNEHLMRQWAHRAGWAAWTTVAVIGLYTVPVMLYPLGSIVAWIVLNRHRIDGYRWRPLLGSLTLTGVISALLYLPVMLRSGALSLLRHAGATSREGFPELLVYLQYTWQEWIGSFPGIFGLLLPLGLCVTMITFVVKRQPKQAIPLWLASLAFLVPGVLVQQVAPPSRIWLFLFPLTLIIAMAGWKNLLSGLGIRVPVPRTILSVLTMWTAWGVYQQFPPSSEFAMRIMSELPQGSVYATLYDMPLVEFYLKSRQIPYRYLSTQQDIQVLAIQPGKPSKDRLLLLPSPQHLDEATFRHCADVVGGLVGHSYRIEPIFMGARYGVSRLRVQ